MTGHFSEMDLHEVPTGTLARILATTDGTVCIILEAYLGEAVSVVKLDESLERAGAGAGAGAGEVDLPVEPGERLLRRTIVLRGERSEVNFLHAECVIRADRLPPGVLDELLSTTRPLRRILSERRIGTFEEMIGGGREPARDCAEHFDVSPEASMIWRRYRILIGEEPLILISERFPVARFS